MGRHDNMGRNVEGTPLIVGCLDGYCQTKQPHAGFISGGGGLALFVLTDVCCLFQGAGVWGCLF